MIDAQAAAGSTAATRQALIDCDVQIEVPSVKALYPYLPAYWVEHIEQTLFKGPVDSYYARMLALKMARRPAQPSNCSRSTILIRRASSWRSSTACTPLTR
jgi:hypothetical protein